MRPDPARIPRLRAALLAVAVVLALPGCASLEQTPTSAPALPAAADLQATASLGATLDVLQRLIQGGPAEQAETLAQVRRDYENSPRGANQLRYALALAAPQHPARDAATSQRLLRELLAAPETLLPFERSLALIELQRVDTELRLVAENSRLMAEADRERARERSPGNAASAALNRRLQAELDENARLRKALDEARAKLDAIATIEQNITERKPTTEGRRP